MTEPADILQRLREHRLLADAPEEELRWLVEHGELTRYTAGEQLMARGGVVSSIYVILTGHIAIYVERPHGRRKVMEWFGGDLTGKLPYSRMTGSPGDTWAEADSEILMIPAEHTPEIIHACPELTATCVHVMIDRARRFTSASLVDEKMLALGKLASGLAHELNNPAAAIVRSAKKLVSGLTDVDEASRRLAAQGLDEDQLALIDRCREVCFARPSRPWSPLEIADREDAFTEWLLDRGADEEPAYALAESGAVPEDLEPLAQALGGALDAALGWIVGTLSTRAIAREVEGSATRVTEMVTAVKGFTHMDRAIVPQAVDVGQGLRDTEMVLRAKADACRVRVGLDIEEGLPRVRGTAGDLNQMWHNLIENALDAVTEGGTVEVSARALRGKVVVEVADDGVGIADEDVERIFDPFFTSKGVGQGTGLGLEVVRRVLDQHEGEIGVESKPGRTVFRVSLPAVVEG